MIAHEFTIPTSELDAAGKSYAFPIRAVWMRTALEGHEATAGETDGQLDVRVSKSGTDVVVHGRMKAELSMPCARCLKATRVAIDQPLSFLMVPGKALKITVGDDDGASAARRGQEKAEFSAEEADIVTYDGETVVLDDVVRDELVLETPMIPLCSEDCPGISPHLGAPAPPPDAGGDKPLDPRLAPLLRLKKQQKE